MIRALWIRLVAPLRTSVVPTAALALASAACGVTTGGEPEPEPEPIVGWQVGASEHVALWYHGLATVLGNGRDDHVLPRFEPGYADEIAQVKRRRGVAPTPLEQRADEFRRTFDASYEGLEFVPLYFRSADALFFAIEVWESAGGNPRRAGSLQAARVIQFLSSLFPRAAQRAAVVEWAGLLQQERQLFFQSYWQERQDALQPTIQAVQREWDALAPALRDYLDFVQLENGELFLVPALSVEGRLVTQSLTAARAAILEPPSTRPELSILAFVHELAYPVSREAVRDNVAPARIRELGEERLFSLAAVRGGSMLLEEVAPERVEAYQRLYLDAAGQAQTVDGDVDAAFRAAFPLPEGLESGLRTAVERSLAGI